MCSGCIISFLNNFKEEIVAKNIAPSFSYFSHLSLFKIMSYSTEISSIGSVLQNELR